MKVFKWIVASAVLCISSTLVAGESNGVIVSHYEPLQRLSFRTDRTETTQELRGAGPVSLSFDALGQSFELQLEPYSGFLSAATRNTLPDDVGIYRGQLAGNPDSWTRIVVYDGAPRGLVWDGEQMYAIEAPGDSIVQADSPVIYRLADTFIEPGTMSCGSEFLSGNGAVMFGKLVGELGTAMAQGPGAVSEIEIGAVGDFEFTSAQGGDANAAVEIAARLAMVDGIFSQEIGIQIKVPLIDTFSDIADPFTESDPFLLLNELTTYRQGTPAQDSLGLTHLWTGRNLDGTTVGIAWNDVLCRSGVGSGLSEGNGSAAFDSLIAAHEIGHNFGAPHDGEMGSVCESEPTTFIMAPMLNGSMQFSLCTTTIMQTNAAAATSCITPLLAVDMAVALNNQVSTVLLGANTVLTYDVPNNGTLQATNVLADFTIPTNLSIDSVAASIGSCTNGAGTVNCVLGNVPGGSNHTVTIATTPTTVGVGMLTATITADVDADTTNNSANDTVTVNSPNGGSGGGAIGLPFLWLLGLTAFLTRRRSMSV